MRRTGWMSVAALGVPVAALSQTAEPPAARITAPRPCDPSAGSGDEVVVCGVRNRGDQFRIPEAFRDDYLPEPEISWDRRMYDLLDQSRYDGEAVGPGGYLKHGLEMDREWRDERELLKRERERLERQVDEAR